MPLEGFGFGLGLGSGSGSGFAGAAASAYVDRMAQSIARHYPRQFSEMGVDGTRAFIGRAIARGRGNHVETEGGVAVLMELMIQFGEDFQRSKDRDWAHRMLAHPTLPAQLKMTLIHRRMTELSRGRVIVPFAVSI